MTRRKTPEAKVRPLPVFPIAAIVSLDPAGVGDAGIAVRLTRTLGEATTETIRLPDWTYAGPIFNQHAMDDLATFLCSKLPEDGKVVLVTEDSAYRSYAVARHIGRGIGGLEMILQACNYIDSPKDTVYVRPVNWRTYTLPGFSAKMKREELKALAITTVNVDYGVSVSSDMAEAILINDFAVFRRRDIWVGSKVKKVS